MSTVSRRSLHRILALALVLVAFPRAGSATVVPTGFSDQLVLNGLDSPTGFTFLPDGQRMLIVEQNTALLSMLNLNGALITLVLVPGLSTTGEDGLLDAAVD